MQMEESKPVTSQPGANATAVTAEPREWASDLFDCCADPKVCLCGTFCYPCLLCSVSKRMGEGIAFPTLYYLCCCDFGAVATLLTLRTKMRLDHNIKGTMLDDAVLAGFCFNCALCQMTRELEHVGK